MTLVRFVYDGKPSDHMYKVGDYSLLTAVSNAIDILSLGDLQTKIVEDEDMSISIYVDRSVSCRDKTAFSTVPRVLALAKFTDAS